MLKKIKIKQFAIIDDIELDFYAGMTVLTGETGAGKSMIIDAISLLLGERADKTMVRAKANEAYVEGIFEVKHPQLKNILDYENIDFQDAITIQRVISKDNSNVIKINDQRVTLKLINDIAPYLADIHSQFDTTSLIHPEKYVKLIDDFRRDKVTEYLQSYQQRLKKYHQAYDDYHRLKEKKHLSLQQLDLYQFQVNELTKLDLSSDELEASYQKVNFLNNIDKINYNLAESVALLDEQGLIEQIYHIKNNIEEIQDTSDDFKDVSERLSNIYYELKDIETTLSNQQDNLDYDPRELATLNDRIHELEKIQKKYDMNIVELIDYLEQIKQSIDEIENYDELLKTKEQDLVNEYEQLTNQARQLSQLRQTIATKITKEIIDSLKFLEIEHADFEIQFQDIELNNHLNQQPFKHDGIDQIDFLISTNKGEPKKPLSKTASGGEMSRVMLTFKTIFAKSQKIPTIIFDEIDTGVSGFIAKKIGLKISETSQFAQVISISHSPQVVAEGIHHLSITKKVIDQHTKVDVNYLSYDERVEEIAKMMSAKEVTESARQIAKELLIR